MENQWKWKEQAVIIKQDKIATDIYSIWFQTESIAKAAQPGQFLSIYCKEGSRLLPRPISICEVEKEQNRLRVVYRIVGEGTKEFSSYKSGDRLDIMGPLGNGYRLKEHKKAYLIGGGIGIFPLYELAKELKQQTTTNVQVYLGFRNKDLITLEKEFKEVSDELNITTDY